ncbi:hypothetical protein EDB19DRAFT_1764906 [Suillus lakei]|nr:hypothetical protein EDB19DRAFT_1764906 [Suillus lakei]
MKAMSWKVSLREFMEQETQKFTSREFIDLIHDSTSSRVNRNPSNNIAVGDYGIIDKQTGNLVQSGNIYSPHFMEQLRLSRYKFDIDLADPALRPTERDGGGGPYIVKSRGVTTETIIESPGVPGSADDLKIKFHCDGHGPLAVVVIDKPIFSSLPNDERIIRLLKSMPGVLKGQYIVTEVVSCAQFMMHLSDKGRFFSITFKANAGGTLSWSLKSASDFSCHGIDSVANFMPLYSLKEPCPPGQLHLFPGLFHSLFRFQQYLQTTVISFIYLFKFQFLSISEYYSIGMLNS